MSAQNQYPQKNRYEEIVDSFKQVSDRLQQLQKANVDPGAISFIKAHLDWIADQLKNDDVKKILTDEPAMCGIDNPRIPAIPPRTKAK